MPSAEEHDLEEYIAVDANGRKVAGPFAYHRDAKKHADAAGGYVKFLAEEAARDFDSPEAAIEHEKKAGSSGPVNVYGGTYLLYPSGMGKRLYYHGGKYHVARRGEPIEVPEAAEETEKPWGIWDESKEDWLSDENGPMRFSTETEALRVWHLLSGNRSLGVRRVDGRKRSSIPEPVCTLAWSKAKHGRKGETKWIARGGSDCGGYDIRPSLGPQGGSGWWVVWGPGGEPIGHGEVTARRPSSFHFDSFAAAKDCAQRHYEASLSRSPIARAAEEPAKGLAIMRRNLKAVRAGRKNSPLATAKDIYAFASPELLKLSQEVVIVIPLNLHGRPLAPTPYVVAMGQRDGVSINIEDILRPVIETNASSFVVCHNHPSGDAHPSEADRQLTDQIRAKAFKTQPMIDHVIVGDKQFYSFTDDTLYTVGGENA